MSLKLLCRWTTVSCKRVGCALLDGCSLVSILRSTSLSREATRANHRHSFPDEFLLTSMAEPPAHHSREDGSLLNRLREHLQHMLKDLMEVEPAQALLVHHLCIGGPSNLLSRQTQVPVCSPIDDTLPSALETFYLS